LICAHSGEGFCPLVICPGWQVAQLNDRADLHGEVLSQVERHMQTDEVFLLVRGRAILLAASERGDVLKWDVLPMAAGVTYTVPKGVWHAIVTFPGVQVAIVEKDRTHESDVFRRPLTADERKVLRQKLNVETGGGAHA